jgi:hypothetical protein
MLNSTFHSAFVIQHSELHGFSMDEQALRVLVREAVAKRLQGAHPASPADRPVTFAAHVSHARYVLPESDGPCLIEPTVPCNHCGYCQSHGH